MQIDELASKSHVAIFMQIVFKFSIVTGCSIGTLGSGQFESHVSEVTVNGAQLMGTINGVKTRQVTEGYTKT